MTESVIIKSFTNILLISNSIQNKRFLTLNPPIFFGKSTNLGVTEQIGDYTEEEKEAKI